DQSEILHRGSGRLDRGVGAEIIGEDLGHCGADLIVDAGRSSGCDRDEVSAFLTVLAASATATAASGGEQCDRSDARGCSEETESSIRAHTAVLILTLDSTWHLVVLTRPRSVEKIIRQHTVSPIDGVSEPRCTALDAHHANGPRWITV